VLLLTKLSDHQLNPLAERPTDLHIPAKDNARKEGLQLVLCVSEDKSDPRNQIPLLLLLLLLARNNRFFSRSMDGPKLG